MRSSAILALVATFSATTSAVYQGFNYGSTQTDGSVKDQAVFEAEFKAAKALTGTSGAFTSARLYTCIVATTADPISAIPAAIAQDTTLLLGIWASAGSTIVDNEITALKAAITKYGDDFTSRVAGISVGSEDLYRITPTGIAAGSNPGADAATFVSYIKQVRAALAGTALSSTPIGHVDTWTAWVIGTNADVITNVDWLGVDAYPYFQNTQANAIENGESLFFDAYDATAAVSGGKPVWITETGWPVSGKTEADAVPSLANAKTYWDAVGCAKSFGKINTWWFTLQDSFPTTPNPSFGIVGTTLSSTPLFDLSCDAVSSDSTKATESTSSSASASASAASSATTDDSAASATASAGAGETTSATGSGAVVVSTSTASATGTGLVGTGGIVTSTTTANTSVSTASSPSGTTSSAASSSSNSTNSGAASFHSHIMGAALGAVFLAAALLL